ncbi:asparaginase [Catellatospora vulcania]|uniref:asparaginase n=1 Tax=Catellatospora vulcania TaxID=1460450 RepID=UPI0012D3B330|nr:asparaginase domain-containing protein [Catellatospora vulcania]
MGSRVLLLATKDTIAYRRRAGRESVASGAQLLAAAGPVGAEVTVVDVTSEPGWDISPTTMLALGRRVRQAAGEYDGVVLTHGVDTVEETAYLVDLMAGPAAERAAIVLTGAFRALDDADTDGPANLAAALAAAADPAARGLGALVCAAGELHAARWATLVDASGPGFSSAPSGPLARIVDGRVERLAAPPPRPPYGGGEPEWDVVLFKTHPGMDPELLAGLPDRGVQGVVLEGTGQGNVPASLFAAISDLIDDDVPVVIASRSHHPAGSGDLPRDIGMAERLGAIPARGLRADKARIALMAALGDGYGVDAVRAWFARL